jgi:hypothetical protein
LVWIVKRDELGAAAGVISRHGVRQDLPRSRAQNFREYGGGRWSRRTTLSPIRANIFK